MSDFEEWLRSVCFQKPTPEAYDLAKSVWNAALDKAANAINRRQDYSSQARNEFVRTVEALKE